MYQSYNATNNSYGIIWHNFKEACEAIRYFSKAFKSKHCVVDKDTGEVLRIYENGKEIYRG